MSLLEEPSQERAQAEIRVQEEDLSNDSDREDRKDRHVKEKGLLKTIRREKRTVSPLTLLKEDLNQFKEEVLKVLKDVRTEEENRPSSRTEIKPTSSTLDLLRDDLSQFKEDVSGIFGLNSSKDTEAKSTEPKTSQPAEKTINPLSLIKEDISNVFRTGLSKERDNKGLAVKDESSNLKVDDRFRNLFRRDQIPMKTCEKAEDSQGVEKTLSEKTEDQMGDGIRDDLTEQDNETVDAEKMNTTEEVDLDMSEEEPETTAGFSDHSGDTRRPSRTEQLPITRDRSDNSSVKEEPTKEEKEEDEPPGTLSWETLVSGISLFNLTNVNEDVMRDQVGGDLWSPKKFACYLTFDPTTANAELHLTDCNRTATRVWSDRRSSDHPDRFRRCPQVLCREGLLDSAYWEVEWSGGADVGVTSNNISRDGDAARCLLGHNEWSWSLECSEGSYTPCYNNKRFRSTSPEPFTRRVGVYLNWSAGYLSFYCVSQDAMVHLHTFTSTFTEPLYPGFWVWAYDGSVSLCQVKLEWERLL